MAPRERAVHDVHGHALGRAARALGVVAALASAAPSVGRAQPVPAAPAPAPAPAPPAPAPSPEERARALHAAGTRAYDLAEYDQAIRAFRDAYELAPAPALLFNLAQAYRLKGPSGCALAVRFYRNYLLAAPDAKNRVDVERTIGELEPCAEVAAPAEPAGPLAPEPAPTTPATRPSAPTPTVEPAPAGPRRWPPYVVLGAGLVVAATGGVFYAIAGSRYGELEEECAARTCPRSRWEDSRTLERVGVGLAIAGGATAIAGTIWAITRSRAAAASTEPQAHVVPTGNGAALVVTF